MPVDCVPTRIIDAGTDISEALGVHDRNHTKSCVVQETSGGNHEGLLTNGRSDPEIVAFKSKRNRLGKS